MSKPSRRPTRQARKATPPPAPRPETLPPREVWGDESMAEQFRLEARLPAAQTTAILATVIAAEAIPGGGRGQTDFFLRLAGAPSAEQDAILERLTPGVPLAVTLLWSELGLVAPARLRQLLAWRWPIDAGGVPAALVAPLVRAFRTAGFTTDAPGTLPPTTPLRLCRGVRRSDRPGLMMSWTTDPAVAALLARPPEGTVYVAEIPPEGVLALISAAALSEVVVDPSALRHVRRLDQVLTAAFWE